MKAVRFTDGALKLADQIVKAVREDEQSEGCDISGGLFGPSFSRLISDLAEVQDQHDKAELIAKGQGYRGEAIPDVMSSMVAVIKNSTELIRALTERDDDL